MARDKLLKSTNTKKDIQNQDSSWAFIPYNLWLQLENARTW